MKKTIFSFFLLLLLLNVFVVPHHPYAHKQIIDTLKQQVETLKQQLQNQLEELNWYRHGYGDELREFDQPNVKGGLCKHCCCTVDYKACHVLCKTNMTEADIHNDKNTFCSGYCSMKKRGIRMPYEKDARGTP